MGIRGRGRRMKIFIHAIGHFKENYWVLAEAEYLKRLRKYSEVEVIEYNDEPIPSKSSPSIDEKIKEVECDKILSKLSNNDYVVCLDLNGKCFDSVSLSLELQKWFSLGGSSIHFVIGGSLGLSEKMKKRANVRWTFSPLTFPHQLARIILEEQLYRAFRIAHNEPYHK